MVMSPTNSSAWSA